VPRPDAVVVGGGPAGSSCAAALGQAGMDVLVMDRASFPRDKPCAGWVTPPVFEALGLEPGVYGRERTLQPIFGFRTGVMGADGVETRYREPVSYGIRRCEFDDFLLRRSGARLATGAAVSSLRRDGGGWVINEEVRTPLLVGAGGHFCPVARWLNPRGRPEPVVAAREIEFPLESENAGRCRVAPDTPELYFCPDLLGYGWAFRKGRHLNVGLGRLDSKGLVAHVEAFVRDLVARGRISAELPPLWRGHAYLLHDSSPRALVADGVLLAGDAAGLAYAASGEGIRPAVESGLLAARAILAAGGRYGRERLEPYRTAVEARFGRRGRLPHLPGALAVALGRRLLGLGWFARRVVVERWFLRAGEPALGGA
jgi:geranylgeranyl reductase family protein